MYYKLLACTKLAALLLAAAGSSCWLAPVMQINSQSKWCMTFNKIHD
jgi:hypothetical protein